MTLCIDVKYFVIFIATDFIFRVGSKKGSFPCSHPAAFILASPYSKSILLRPKEAITALFAIEKEVGHEKDIYSAGTGSSCNLWFRVGNRTRQEFGLPAMMMMKPSSTQHLTQAKNPWRRG
jgi:hypothetical protein